jgi:hypothetical protein
VEKLGHEKTGLRTGQMRSRGKIAELDCEV